LQYLVGDTVNGLGKDCLGFVQGNGQTRRKSGVLYHITVNNAHVFNFKVQVFFAGTAYLLGNIRVFGSVHHVHNEPRMEIFKVAGEFFIRFRIDLFYFRQHFGDVEFLMARAVFAGFFKIRFGRGIFAAAIEHQAENGVFKEHIGVKHRGYRRRRDHNALSGKQEKIQDGLVGSRAQVQNKDVGFFFQFKQMFYQGLALGSLKIGRAGYLVVAGNKAQTPYIGVYNNVGKIGFGIV